MASNGSSHLQDALNREAKRLIVDCTYSGRSHQTAGRRLATLNTWLGGSSTVVSAALSSAAGFTAIFGNQKVLAGALALLAAVLTGLQGYLRFDRHADEHGLKGDRYISLRNDARMFREIDTHLQLTDEERSQRLRDLRQRYNDLNESPPRHIQQNDYERAKQSIAKGESNYEDDPVWKEMED